MYNKEAINHKYEYKLKQDIFNAWWLKDITGKESAIKSMKRDLEILKEVNPQSEYIKKCESYIEKCEATKEAS